MEFNWQTRENKQLIKAILSLRTTKEAEAFLRDLMTEGEIAEFGKRLEAARLLSDNVQYSSIIESTGLSSTTVARISKWLRGSLGGYRLILNRLSPRQSSGQIFVKNSHHHNPAKLGKGLLLK
jgi:TrpR-related protein YerC/YecD